MRTKERRAFTLSEFLIVTFLEAAIIAMTIQAFVSLNKDSHILMSYLGSYLKGREAIDIISKDCRMAVRLVDSYGGYTTSTSCLVLKVPSIDASGAIIDVNNEFDYVIYELNINGDLANIVIPGSSSARPAENKILQEAIKSFFVSRDGVPLADITHKSSITHVTLTLLISEKILGRDYVIQPGTTVKFMNYDWGSVR